MPSRNLLNNWIEEISDGFAKIARLEAPSPTQVFFGVLTGLFLPVLAAPFIAAGASAVNDLGKQQGWW